MKKEEHQCAEELIWVINKLSKCKTSKSFLECYKEESLKLIQRLEVRPRELDEVLNPENEDELWAYFKDKFLEKKYVRVFSSNKDPSIFITELTAQDFNEPIEIQKKKKERKDEKWSEHKGRKSLEKNIMGRVLILGQKLNLAVLKKWTQNWTF